MENHNRACLSGQDRKGGQHRNSGGQHHQIIHMVGFCKKNSYTITDYLCKFVNKRI